MQTCRSCGHEEPESSRFCTRCGIALRPPRPANPAIPSAGLIRRDHEEMNVATLYAMIVALIVALLVPPWETPPGQAPAFLGFHFFLQPPETGQGSGIISRLLLTIELVTIAVAGFYFSWLFRKKG